MEKIPCPTVALAEGDRLNGFLVLRRAPIPDLRVTAVELVHEATGALVLHLQCEDPENLFAVAFRTPPEDATGLPHILEHCVLAGSERYPIKDAFNELIRGTLQTFLNAFTYPDKTVYPAASLIRKDFFNLARVYLDLVFHPRLRRETFLQEGHHLTFRDLDDPESPLVVSGIVFNEMKGAYSSPESLSYKALQEGLLPDTIYVHDSGGDPRCITDLTYDQFRRFHERYYCPGNARFFLYGNIPTRDHLVLLEEILTGSSRREIPADIASQRRWPAPRTIRRSFPISRTEKKERKAMVHCAWLLAESTDATTALLLAILSHVLIGSAAGPLRKALIDSKLGEDLSPVCGMENELKQSFFAVGLRGTEPQWSERIESLILHTLQAIVDSGIDRTLLEGTLHQVEFQGREIVRGSMPYGITLMGRVFPTWLYGGDALAGLNFPGLIAWIRERWAAKPGLFEEAINQWLLSNPHRLLVVMEPSLTYLDEQEQESFRRLEKIRKSLSSDGLEEIRAQARILEADQRTPDTAEDLARLPQIQIGDIPLETETTPTVWTRVEGVPVMHHPLFTNGIGYVALAFDVSHIPGSLQPYLPLLGKLTVGMGAAGMDYETLAKRINLFTGGIGYQLTAGLTQDGSASWQRMIFHVKSLHRNLRDALDILGMLLFQGDLSDRSRLHDLVLEKKNGLIASVIPAGHTFARRTAAASLNLPSYRDEQWHGHAQLRFVAALAAEWEKEQAAFAEFIDSLRAAVFSRDQLVVNCTTDPEGFAQLQDPLRRLLAQASRTVMECPGKETDAERQDIGISVPAQVSYVAGVLPAPVYGADVAPSLSVLSRYLSTGYLYREIRVRRGAYGGMSQYDPWTGAFSFLSYRDPCIVETLATYGEALRQVSAQAVPEEDVQKAVIGTIGGIDRPLDPSSRGQAALLRFFAGIDDPDRQAFRRRILEISSDDLRRAADNLHSLMESAMVRAVYGPEEALKKANECLSPPLRLEALT